MSSESPAPAGIGKGPVFVTGASGHVGGVLVRALLEAGREVRVLVHGDDRALQGLNVTVFHGDVANAEVLRAAMRGVETVYHLAVVISLWWNDPTCQSTNVDGTETVLRLAREAGVRRLVYVSSIHAFEREPVDEPLDENRALCAGPAFPAYDRSKAEATRRVMKAVEDGLDAVVIHPTGIVGPTDFRPSRMGGVVRDVMRGQLPALVKGGFDWVDVRDVVGACMAAERLAPKGARYLAGGAWRSMSDVAAIVAEHAGCKPPRMVLPLAVGKAVAPFAQGWAKLTRTPPRFTSASMFYLEEIPKVDCSRAKRELGYAPRPLEESLKDAVEWWKSYDPK